MPQIPRLAVILAAVLVCLAVARPVIGAISRGAIAGGAGPVTSAGQGATAPDSAKIAQYQHDVLPVLQENCLRCHGGMNRRGGYNMANRTAAIAGGHHGAAIIPGNPEDSLLIKLIGPGPYPDDIKPMPLKGKLSDTDIAVLRKWVADGAVMDQQ